MSWIGETTRGITTLGYYFAGAPLVALRTPPDQLAAARVVALAHAARARRLGQVTLELVGEERVPREGGFVLVYNQTSVADDLTNIEVVWRLTERNVMAAEYKFIPFFRRAAARTGILLLRRGDRTAADQLLRELTAHAAAGGRVAMAAEGRLSPDGAVGHFKRGAFLVAIRAGVPVVPMAVSGGQEILPPWSLRMRPGVIRYRIGTPLETEGLTESDAPLLAEQARQSVAQLYECEQHVAG